MRKRTLARRLGRRRQRKTRLERYRRAYYALMALVSDTNEAECMKCGALNDLLLHHIDGKTWRSRDLRLDKRVQLYQAEYARGVRLEVLCRGCHTRHHNKENKRE